MRKKSFLSRRFIVLLTAIFLFFLPAATFAEDYYVKTMANGGDDDFSDGLSWAAAKATITCAMGLAVGGDNVHVAAGTYSGTVNFPSASSIQLLGGYPADAVDSSTQDPWTNTTIIDGGSPVISIPWNGGTRSYTGLVIDGFTVKNGSKSSSGAAGIESYSAGLTIKRCIIENNTVTGNYGTGGVYVFSPYLDSLVFFKMQDCIVRNNAGPGTGGVLFDSNGYSQGELTNCLIYGNSATDSTTDGSYHIYTTGGVAVGGGGYEIASFKIINCTIANNTSVHPVSVGGVSINTDTFSGPVEIYNSIIWHETLDDIYVPFNSPFSVDYSDIHDSDTGTSVIHTDPAFAGTSDYHLTSGSGDCIDGGTTTGAPVTDLEGTARPQGSGFDMGAYEYMAPAGPADITVTDNKGTVNDQVVPFGNVTVGESAEATVTIKNDGNADLNIGTITDPASPFSIDESCSDQSLAPAASCYVTVTFAPAAAGAFSDTFSIPSDDLDENPVTVTVSGNGVSPVTQYTLTTAVDPAGSGTVTLDPAGGTYDEGTSVSLTATSNSNYMFDGWDGEVADFDSETTTTTMNADKTITAVFMADDDNDGVATEEEQGPDGTDATYDGDSSGTADSLEDNVASGHTFDGAYYVTLAAPATQSLANVGTNDNPSSSDSPSGVSFPYGFFDFTVAGVTPGDPTTVTIYLPAGEAPTTYWKYGPTPTDGTDHWYEFLYDGTTGAEIIDNEITLYFVDGQRGDDDLAANGVVSDIGAPAKPASAGSSGGSGGCFINAITE